MMSQPHGSAKALPQPRVVAERKWQLGQHSRDHPSAIMSKLMRFMASNHIAWKKNGTYSLKCCRVGYTQGERGSSLIPSLLIKAEAAPRSSLLAADLSSSYEAAAS